MVIASATSTTACSTDAACLGDQFFVLSAMSLGRPNIADLGRWVVSAGEHATLVQKSAQVSPF